MGIKVFVDANIFKYSATELHRFYPRQQAVVWGSNAFTTTVHDLVVINPNDNIRNNEILRREVSLIPEIVALQTKENIEFCVTFESDVEVMGLPDMDSRPGKLYGAKISYIEPPIEYSRVVIGWDIDAKEEQYDFIKRIKSKRFLEIQRATGAYQGINPPNRNQLLDAFHLWCAEHAKCDVFLTGEATKLKRSMSNKRDFSYGTKVLLPSELLSVLDGGLNKKICRQITRWIRQKIRNSQ